MAKTSAWMTLGMAAAMWSSTAQASGIAAARFGGEHGHPTTDNPTALYYNPAGIALSKGTHIFVDGTIVLRFASYTRPASEVTTRETSAIAPGANDGKATLFNAIAAPFVGVSSDFGTDWIYGGLALYFPFGGAAVWEENPSYKDSEQFPGAVDGVQRWHSIDGSIRSMYVTGGLAFNIRQIGLSLGVTGSVIRNTVETIRARNTSGSDDLVVPTADGTKLEEGRSYLKVGGWQGGFGIGAIYDVLKLGKYFIGLSYTSQPNVTGGMALKGTLNNAFATGTPTPSDVELTQTLPDIVRLGFRVRPTEKYEIRVFADYTRWSVFDKQCVMNRVPGRNCDFANEDTALSNPTAFGGDADPSVTQLLPRYWKDAGGVRVGGSYWFVPQVEGYLGAGYDSSAVPLETLDAALMDMHKMTVSAGVRWQIIRRLALAFTATEVIFFRTSTKGKSVLNRFAAQKQPSANGVYTQFYQLFNIYLDVSFGGGGKKAKAKAKAKSKGKTTPGAVEADASVGA